MASCATYRRRLVRGAARGPGVDRDRTAPQRAGAPGVPGGTAARLAVALIEAGALPPAERAAAGDALGRLGDPRPACLTVLEFPISPGATPGGRLPDGQHEADREMATMRSSRSRRSTCRPIASAGTPRPTPCSTRSCGTAATRERWRRCWTDAGWKWKGDRGEPEKYGGVFDLPNHPVVGVTWYEAIAFCRWLTASWGISDVAHRGAVGEGGARPATAGAIPGARITAEHATRRDGIGTTTAVGVFPRRQPVGRADLAGNVWEWCLTQLARGLPPGAARRPGRGRAACVRGGVFEH